MRQKKTASKTSAAKKTANKKKASKNTGVSKAASKKATSKTAATKNKAKKGAAKKAATKRLPATATSLKFRAVCLTDKKTLGSWTTNEQAARDAATQHEVDFPSHVTDVEEKG